MIRRLAVVLGLAALLCLAGAAPGVVPAAQAADCGLVDVGCKVAEAINDAFVDLANKMIEAAGDTMASLATFWIDAPAPDITDSPTVEFIQGSLWYYMAGAAVLAVIVGGARMAWEQRAQPGKDLVRALLTLTIVAGASTTGIGLAVEAADGFAEWIIDRSTPDFGGQLVELLSISDADVGVMAVLLIIFVALIAMLVSLIQIVLLVVRGGFLVVLAGVLPTAAAFTNTDQGRAWFQRAVAWVLAYVLYKPAAAIIYATAFQLVDQGSTAGEDRILNAVTGVTLMIMSVIALPALLRFLTPLVAAAAGGGGGGGIGAAAVAVPAGAIAMRGARGGGTPPPGGGGAGAGGAGPSGGGPSGGRAPGAPPPPPVSGPAPGGSPASPPPGGGAAGGGGGAVPVMTRGAHIAAVLGTSGATGAGAPPPTSPDDDSTGGPRGSN